VVSKGLKGGGAMAMGNQAGGIHVTPIIDVLLVLLIIFLVIAPERAKGLEAKAPGEAAAKEAEDVWR